MAMNTTRRSSVRMTSAATKRRLELESAPALKKFVKIILLSTIKENMMKIPARFVRLGPKLSDSVTIETHVGFKRTVGIKRVGDEVWFDNGWTEFAEAHSLSEGHFLFFHYKGNLSFLVIICDVSASEIEYPLDKALVIESDIDDEVMEVVDDEGFTAFETTDNDSREGVIDLEDFFKQKPIVNIKSEEVFSIDIDSMDEVEEDMKILRL